MRLVKNVYLAGGGAYGYSHANDCNIYLVDGGSSLALIDTGGGSGVEAIVNNIRSFGLDPKKVELTLITHSHFDHTGGNIRMKELTGCRIAMHEAEAAAYERLDPGLTLVEMAERRGLKVEAAKVDLKLKDGKVLKVGGVELKVVHTPGHTPGHICLFLETDGKRILSQGMRFQLKEG